MKGRVLIISSCILVLGLVMYILVSPVICGITPRSYANIVIADTGKVRVRIAEKISTGEPIGDVGRFTVVKGEGAMPIDFGWITAGGCRNI